MLVEIPLLNRFLSLATSRRLDDFVDRLHFVRTVTLLVLCAMFVGMKQHFGQPIQCMLPAHLDRGSWTSYAQYFCFVENTYRLTYNRTVPGTQDRISIKQSSGIEVNYYQWVPYFFAIQALCFYIPSWIWHLLQQYGMLDIKAIVDEAVSIRGEIKMEQRTKKLDKVVQFIRGSFEYRDKLQQSVSCLGVLTPNRFGFFSTVAYLATKLIWLTNDIVQLIVISRFLNINDFTWALQPSKLITTVTDSSSPATLHYFPRVTFCDMERYTLGHVEVDTFQCVLMLNVINEKLFIMLWFWIVFLIVASVINFICTINELIHPRCRNAIFNFYLQGSETVEDRYFLACGKRNIRAFIDNVLGTDGVLMLRFVRSHAGVIVARDITVRLFRLHTATYESTNEFCSGSVQHRPIASAPERNLESVDDGNGGSDIVEVKILHNR
ncbi:Innexin-3 [Toxocara canis]|uniref:Innexin n=1 Tax=Toxocara canis TaxID=6265 RepID=A0A0B2VE65_TOXCA|nr:Innexin-3 [Toxocara canis]